MNHKWRLRYGLRATYLCIIIPRQSRPTSTGRALVTNVRKSLQTFANVRKQCAAGLKWLYKVFEHSSVCLPTGNETHENVRKQGLQTLLVLRPTASCSQTFASSVRKQ